MLRRQVLSHDDLVHKEFYHQTSPRKWRTYGSAKNYIPSIMYSGIPKGIDSSWVGKKIIYWNGDSVKSYIRQIRETKYGDSISEYDIARYARPNIYRIIFVDNNGIIRSKIETSYQPSRMNIFVNDKDIITKISYF
jgi:hypothetical protein